ncbi:uncharacterized protein N7477_004261 [Penicillium maclennaniae]|uniref:uncharacterized protein n=1 Tax=Penicillium maclennaniae TaxID=1343394 RepID=UPI00254038E3|nr:uncharacterized protein N7477_004261 [Penicillium maclennaniae]KAJ5674327.1 hypothetical protein N7477_004261 [Penicillium maclennaniae]
MVSATDLALPKGALILVTGANGFIASHVIDQLLQIGYRVRGTVRSEKPWLEEHFRQVYGPERYHNVIVTAMEEDDAFREAMEDVSGVVHVASDMSYDPRPDLVVPRAVAGTMNVLEAAQEEGTVKRVVLTSSSTAALRATQNSAGIVVDENTWNYASIEAAWSADTPEKEKPGIVYSASKTKQELAAWEWYKATKPGFVLNAVLPNVNIGPTIAPEIPGSTTALIRSLLVGNTMPIDLLKPQYFIDVRDTARLHVAALLDRNVTSQRIFAFAHAANWNDIIPILRRFRPNNHQIPDAPENEGRDLSDIRPREQARQLLERFFGQPDWTTLEESLKSSIDGF